MGQPQADGPLALPLLQLPRQVRPPRSAVGTALVD
jgi:hypothetical protein